MHTQRYTQAQAHMHSTETHECDPADAVACAPEREMHSATPHGCTQTNIHTNTKTNRQTDKRPNRQTTKQTKYTHIRTRTHTHTSKHEHIHTHILSQGHVLANSLSFKTRSLFAICNSNLGSKFAICYSTKLQLPQTFATCYRKIAIRFFETYVETPLYPSRPPTHRTQQKHKEPAAMS